ncbi:MAG: transporter substrate-binding domain-containing protein [Paraglaciecola sp.]|uniref:substrate-binding periplasmic protein n=1 Tax=Paraglaciecola sp. TaxID=1920173 RepID=UPI003297F476
MIRIFLCFLVGFIPSSFGSALDVYIAEYPPFQVIDNKNGHTGFSVELFKEVLDLTDIDANIIAVPWVRALEFVTQQSNSLLFAMAKTPERDKLYTWVDTIYMVNEGVFARKDRTDIHIDSLEDVHQYSIALPRGDVSVSTLNISSQPSEDVYIVEHQEQCIRMLAINRVELNYNNDVGFFNAVKSYGLEASQFKQVYITKRTELGIAANKNMDAKIIAKIREALKTLKQNGVYHNLKLKWFATN